MKTLFIYKLNRVLRSGSKRSNGAVFGINSKLVKSIAPSVLLWIFKYGSSKAPKLLLKNSVYSSFVIELVERVHRAWALFACSASLSLSFIVIGTVIWSEYFFTRVLNFAKSRYSLLSFLKNNLMEVPTFRD